MFAHCILIWLNGVVHLNWLSGAQYCISRPAKGCSSYTHILSQYMKVILFFLELIYSGCAGGKKPYLHYTKRKKKHQEITRDKFGKWKIDLI